MKNKILEKEVNIIGLEPRIIKVLNDNDIYAVKELWTFSRKNLKNMGLNDSDINSIIIKLQLFGLDLNKKVY